MRRLLLSLMLVVAAGCQSSDKAQEPPAATQAAAPAAATPAPAPTPAPAAKAELEVGTRLEGATTVAVADIGTRTDALAGKPIKVSGVVKDVCQHRGCWVEIADGDATILAKSLAHDVLLPKDATGKRIEIEGTLRVDDAASSCDHAAGEEHAHGDEGHGEEGHSCPSPETLIELRYAALYPAS